MKINDFLQKATDKKYWKNKKVLCFKGAEYSFLFFNKLFKALDKKGILPAEYKSLIDSSSDKTKILSSIQQSFLGQTNFYWLGLCENAKCKTDFIKILSEYKGPNVVAFYLREEKLASSVTKLLKKIDCIEVENKVDFALFESIQKLFDYDLNHTKKDFVKKIFKNISASFSFDSVCMLLQYLELINTNLLENFRDYLFSSVLDVQPSLDLLSQHFFSRQPKSFFKVWSKVYNDYPEMFWISFWSEQIWKAYNVIRFLQEKNFVAARSISYRLPYMFIKKDWERFSLDELAKDFQLLYDMDFALKTGSTFCFLDMFYFKHFNKVYF